MHVSLHSIAEFTAAFLDHESFVIHRVYLRMQFASSWKPIVLSLTAVHPSEVNDADPICFSPAFVVLARRVLLVATGFALGDRPIVGVQPDGTILTPVGQRLTPPGTQIEIKDRPLGMVLSPNHQLLAVVTGSNFASRALHLIDVNTRTLKQTIAIANSFVGVGFSPSGDKIYVGGGTNDVKVFSLTADGTYAAAVPPTIPGLLVVGAERPLAEPRWHATVCRVEPGERGGGDQHRDVGDRHAGPCGDLSLHHGRVGRRLESLRHELGRQSSTALRCHRRHESRGRRSAHRHPVSGTVSVIDTASNSVLKTIDVGLHPTGMALSPRGDRIYVTNANSDTVSAIDTTTDTVVKTLHVGGSVPAADPGPDRAHRCSAPRRTR